MTTFEFHVGRVTTFSWIFTIACCLVVGFGLGLGLGLDQVYGWLLVTSPSYLQSCFTRVADMTFRWRLRSSNSHRLGVPPVRLYTVGKRAFPISGATVWNDLPLHVASAPSLAVFIQRIKTFLFNRSYQDTIIWLVCYYYLSSLLFGHLWSLQ